MWQRNTRPLFRTTPSLQVRSADQTPLVDETEQRRRSVSTTTHGTEPPVLESINPPLGPQPQNAKFFRSHVVTLVMRNKVSSSTHGDFVVRTVEGEDIIKCQAKLLSMHGKKKFTDMEGNEIYTLCNKLSTVHKSFRAETPAREHDFEVNSPFELGESNPKITFKNAANDDDTILEVIGTWRERNAEIQLGDGRVVASIGDMFFDPRDFFGEKQTYFVAVAPNVDLSLIAGTCVCVDEREGEANG